MWLLIVGLALFFVAHLSSLAPEAKARLRDQLGAGRFRGMYALVSGLGMLLIILGYLQADTAQLYTPPGWALAAAHGAMLIAVILVAGANMPSNLKRYARHPMALGVLIWACVHLIANGTVADVVLFGSFAAYALIDMFVIGSGAPAAARQPIKKDLILVAAGVVGFTIIFLIHTQLKYIGGPQLF